MKQITIFTLFALAWIVTSCSAISYDGEYSDEGYYKCDAKPMVYFYTAAPQDTLIRYSFATDWVEKKAQTVKIPVKLLGNTPKQDLHFAVKVNEQLSTAKEGVNFAALKKDYIIAKDSINSEVEVEIFREGLSKEEQGNTRLVLDLVPTEEVIPVKGMLTQIILTFDDYLKQPEYWMYYEYYWGPYSRDLYLKVLSYYDGSETKFWSSVVEDFTGVSVVMQKVFKYFEEHPEYGIKTPPTLPKPFTD